MSDNSLDDLQRNAWGLYDDESRVLEETRLLEIDAM